MGVGCERLSCLIGSQTFECTVGLVSQEFDLHKDFYPSSRGGDFSSTLYSLPPSCIRVLIRYT